jgi:hypothetical protein
MSMQDVRTVMEATAVSAHLLRRPEITSTMTEQIVGV